MEAWLFFDGDGVIYSMRSYLQLTDDEWGINGVCVISDGGNILHKLEERHESKRRPEKDSGRA